MHRTSLGVAAALAACVIGACEPAEDKEPGGEEGGVSLGGGYVDAPEHDGGKPRVDGGFAAPDGGVLREDRFVTRVVSFEPGACAGFGAAQMPDVVLGPPVGAGATAGGFDVVSLGTGGTIVVAFDPNAIVDGPGPDFVVFENAFFAGGDPTRPAFDPGEVSVSEDGETWATFPCAPTGEGCAGGRPVFSAPGNGVSPVDPAVSGGDAFDLADVGLARARFVRIRDAAGVACDVVPRPNNAGFDLDAIAIVNAERP